MSVDPTDTATACDHTAHRDTYDGREGQIALTAWEPCPVRRETVTVPLDREDDPCPT